MQGRLDETSWTLCQKSGEMALLKSQLKESQTEQSQRCQEMAKMRAQLKEAQESAHGARQRLEQVLGSRRSITSPVLSSRKASETPSASNDEVQWLQRRLAELQQSIEAERQVNIVAQFTTRRETLSGKRPSFRCGTRRRRRCSCTSAICSSSTCRR